MRKGTQWWICLTAMLIAATAFAADSAMTNFSVTKNGFKFINSFSGDIFLDLPIVGRVNVGHAPYGLCGGMSYAAYDNYVYNLTAPTTPGDNPPASGTAIRSYIYDRQMDSFKADNAFMIRRFLEWIPLPVDSKPGITGLQVRSHRQFKRHIKPRLEAGNPVAIALVKADAGDLFNSGQANAVVKNHQVLAIGFALHQIPGDDEWDIYVYDPNFPNDVQTLHTRKRNQTSKSNFNVVTGHFRAFFVLPYSQKKPNWAPANVASPVRGVPAFSIVPEDKSPETEEERRELKLPPLTVKPPL
jgi:hypothetical protein